MEILDNFLEQPLFDGKRFWDVEQEMEVTIRLRILTIAIVIVKSNKIIKRRKEGQMSC